MKSLQKFLRVFYVELQACSLVFMRMLQFVADDGTVDVELWNTITSGVIVHICLELKEGEVDEDFKRLTVDRFCTSRVTEHPFCDDERFKHPLDGPPILHIACTVADHWDHNTTVLTPTKTYAYGFTTTVLQMAKRLGWNQQQAGDFLAAAVKDGKGVGTLGHR